MVQIVHGGAGILKHIRDHFPGIFLPVKAIRISGQVQVCISHRKYHLVGMIELVADLGQRSTLNHGFHQGIMKVLILFYDKIGFPYHMRWRLSMETDPR